MGQWGPSSSLTNCLRVFFGFHHSHQLTTKERLFSKTFPHDFDSRVTSMAEIIVIFYFSRFSASGFTWHANHTMHHKLPYKKKQLILMLLVSCSFFYGHSMEFLSAFYGQLITFMLFFCMVIQWFSCFSRTFFEEQLSISYLHNFE